MKQFIRELEEKGLQKGVYTADEAAVVMREIAASFPFENLAVLNRDESPITEAYIIEKLLNKKRGGLCYELNALLYLVLKELGFSAGLGTGTVKNENGWATDNTHVFVLLQMEGKKYIADSGFGNQLALYPLALDGENVVSPAGNFRLRKRNTEKGTYALETADSEGNWHVRYAFNWEAREWTDLEQIRQIICHHPQSTFNQRPIIAAIRKDYTVSLNDERLLRKFADGREEKLVFKTEADFLKIVRALYSPSITNEAEKLFA